MLPVFLPVRADGVTCWLDAPGWPRLRLFVWVFGKAAPRFALLRSIGIFVFAGLFDCCVDPPPPFTIKIGVSTSSI